MDIVSWLLAKQYTNNIVDAQREETNDIVNVLGAKNMLDIDATSSIEYGINYTFNEDGSVDIQGTTDENGSGILINSGRRFLKGIYKITTGQEIEQGSHVCVYSVNMRTGDIYGISNSDIGGGLGEFIVDENNENASIGFVISCDENLTYDLTIYPMCRLASIEDDTFAPYAKTNQELTTMTKGLRQITPSNIQYYYDEEDISVRLNVVKYDRMVALDCYITPHKEGRFAIAGNLPYCVTNIAYGIGRNYEESPTRISPNEFWIGGDVLYVNIHEDAISSCSFSLIFLCSN